MALLELSGKTFLVIGSTSGIGQSTALKLHGYGATVFLHGPELAPPEDVRELQQSFERWNYLGGDLSDSDGIADLAEAIHKQITQLDGLVYSAAVTSHLDWEKVTAQEWDRVSHINTSGFLHLAQICAPLLQKSKGSIVAVSSTNAERVNHKNMVYDVSKAALNHLIRAIALEMKDDGVRVNGVAPGGVDTPLLGTWLVDYAGTEKDAARVLQESREKGLVADPASIADVIIFLLSEQARWITGEIITADFGASLQG